MVKNLNVEKQRFSDHFCKGSFNKVKPGALLRVNNALDFLMRCSRKPKDHFDLYIPVLEGATFLVLKSCILCGDYRRDCRKIMKKSIKELPEFYKSFQPYDIITPLTPCIEVLHKNDILYLEVEFFTLALKNKWIEVLSKGQE